MTDLERALQLGGQPLNSGIETDLQKQLRQEVNLLKQAGLHSLKAKFLSQKKRDFLDVLARIY